MKCGWRPWPVATRGALRHPPANYLVQLPHSCSAIKLILRFTAIDFYKLRNKSLSHSPRALGVNKATCVVPLCMTSSAMFRVSLNAGRFSQCHARLVSPDGYFAIGAAANRAATPRSFASDADHQRRASLVHRIPTSRCSNTANRRLKICAARSNHCFGDARART
jgi:hypothetical protein